MQNNLKNIRTNPIEFSVRFMEIRCSNLSYQIVNVINAYNT